MGKDWLIRGRRGDSPVVALRTEKREGGIEKLEVGMENPNRGGVIFYAFRIDFEKNSKNDEGSATRCQPFREVTSSFFSYSFSFLFFFGFFLCFLHIDSNQRIE